ncbi:MAG: flagellar hook-length control protein FliK [Gammaproteobacteria bacterium]
MTDVAVATPVVPVATQAAPAARDPAAATADPGTGTGTGAAFAQLLSGFAPPAAAAAAAQGLGAGCAGCAAEPGAEDGDGDALPAADTPLPLALMLIGAPPPVQARGAAADGAEVDAAPASVHGPGASIVGALLAAGTQDAGRADATDAPTGTATAIGSELKFQVDLVTDGQPLPVVQSGPAPEAPVRGAVAQLPAQLTQPLDLSQRAFADDLGARVIWQAGNQVQQVQLNVHPPALGPIEVRLELQQDQTQVQFITHHGAARDAIENALPRLREMMAQAGLQLGDTSVFSQGSQRERTPETYREPTARADDAVAEIDAPGVAVRHGRGLIDAYV